MCRRYPMGQCCVCTTTSSSADDEDVHVDPANIQRPQSVLSETSRSLKASSTTVNSRSSSKNSEGSSRVATTTVRPKNLNLEIDGDGIIKEEDEDIAAEHQKQVMQLKPDEVEKGEGEEETPRTECTVLSCVSRGTSCTQDDIGRTMQFTSKMRPVSSTEFSQVTEELLSSPKIHGWGYHHKLIAKKLKKQYSNEPMKDSQKHKIKHHQIKHHRSKHRRKCEDSVANTDKRKHSSSSKRKKHTRKKYPVKSPDSGSGSLNIPAYRVPPSIAVL